MGTPFFQKKVVIITGASSGIGRELAYRISAQGACLALASRDAGRLENCQGRVPGAGWGGSNHYALPYLKQSRGQIVGVSSLTGKTGVPTRSGYAASKHAMAGFFGTLRIELAPAGVSVTMIYPGFVATEVRIRAFGGDGRPLVNSPVREAEIMSVEQCVDQMLPVIQKRRREVVITLRGKVGLWLKLIAPALVDNIARKAVENGK